MKNKNFSGSISPNPLSVYLNSYKTSGANIQTEPLAVVFSIVFLFYLEVPKSDNFISYYKNYNIPELLLKEKIIKNL